jgi:hypothetical protein
MAADWFVRQGEKTFGPFDAAKLKQLASAGKINAATEVSQSSSGPWAAAGRIRGLFGSSPPSPQPTVPSPQQNEQGVAVAALPFSEESPHITPFSSSNAANTSSHIEQGIRREKIKTYFDAPPLGCAYALAVIGALTVGFYAPGGGSAGANAMIFGAVAAIGTAVIFTKHRKKATEAELDACLEQDIRNLTTLSLSKVGLSQSQMIRDPVVVTGPTVWKVAGTTKASKRGKDGTLRFTPLVVTVFNFTKDQLVGYSCVLDLLTGKPHSESTDEFFYKDIVAVSTKKEAKTMKVDGADLKMDTAETFAVTTSGGNAISVFLTDPALVAKMGGGEIPTHRAEAALEAIRAVVREKKQA